VPLYFKAAHRLLYPAKRAYIQHAYKTADAAHPFNHRKIALETGIPLAQVYAILDEGREAGKQQDLFQNSLTEEQV